METPTTFDKNKSLSSGVEEDSRIKLRAGSMKCPALCRRVRIEEPKLKGEHTANASEVRMLET